MSLKTATAEVTKTADQVLRPVRYTGAGLKGTAEGLFNGMAHFGRKGLWVGLGVGIFVGLTGGFGYTLMLAAAGFAAGAVGGAAFGALKGGYDGVSRAARRDKYSNELAERQAAREDRASRAQGAPRRNPRDARDRKQTLSNYSFERFMQQDMENDRDYATYWQDRVSNGQSNGNGRGY